MYKRILTALAGAGVMLTSPLSAAVNYVYILTGQSNSLGAVKGSPAGADVLKRYESEGILWSGNMVRDTGKPFDPSPSWRQVQPQLPVYNGTPCMGPEYGFAHMMQRRGWHTQANNRVCIIKASLDGGGNSLWMKDKPAYATLVKTLHDGLAALDGKWHVQALLYLQGESDKGEEITKAPTRFLELKTRLQKEVKKGLKYAVVGECATWSGRDAKEKGKTTVQLMHDMTQSKKEIAWVRTRDLTKITSGDNMGVHYDGRSQITIGARYAYAVAALEKLPMGFVRGDDPKASLDDNAAWWGGKAPGARDVMTWDVSALRGADTLKKDMSVAGLLVEDPAAGEVVIGAGGEGEPTPVLQVGSEGITLQEADLSINCALKTTADQTWTLPADRRLKLSSLKGKGVITLQADKNAKLCLALDEAPEHEWLADVLPQVEASIAGKPAHFVKHGSVYRLELAEH